MRLLLDTHAFLWWCADDPQLGEIERAAIRDGANEIFLSAASVWEMATKQALGRLQVPEPASAAAPRMGIVPLPVAFAHAEATVSLPALHRDPFDRLLVAQARAEGLTLVTHDPLVRAYPGVAFLPAEGGWVGSMVGRAEITGDVVAPMGERTRLVRRIRE